MAYKSANHSSRVPKIRRSGYTRKDGIRVKSTLIEDQGKPGKGPKIFGKLKKGTLRKYGYSVKNESRERQKALSEAVDEYGPGVVIKKLTVVGNLMSRTNPTYTQRFRADSAWVKKKFE